MTTFLLMNGSGRLRRSGGLEQYYKSAWFKTLARSTQKARRRILDSICESIVETPAGIRQRGSLPFAQTKAKHVRAIRDEKIDLPEAANGRLKALGQVFARARNPAWGVRDLEAVAKLAGSLGFSAPEIVEMPANNLSLVFKRL